MFDRWEIQRAAEKIKPHCGSEEWVIGLQEISVAEEDREEPTLLDRGGLHVAILKIVE